MTLSARYLTCLVLIGVASTALAADKPEKKGPNKGSLEITVTVDDREKSFDSQIRAITELRRAESKYQRLKSGETMMFSCVIDLNETKYEFTEPAAAREACQALTMATRRLSAIRKGLGDIGSIPEYDEEAAKNAADADAPKVSPAQAMAIVRQRINAALYQQMVPRGSGSGGRPSQPSPPSPQAIQRLIAQEVQKARDEGLLPSNAAGLNPLQAGDPVENEMEAITQMLSYVFSKAETPSEESAEEKETDE
ncbi:hypothetical protein [Thalassoroseus pseudoceratinae]|uniref:hypothetical protein n=1 Tax=Thalassoroseus pseudoceratinae TaxID=2713176 RepID=UPI0014248C55|nr:hypothetical protein [Thalassoroseus pseudoceratinae]